ncbi:T9SS type A sorting domain-containing protein [Aquimarina sp. MMG015]|uniref:T9SS type A sorting domain-containing protein n=1 Tax=Aquimarina sp. MMG015 TaxID=2822689 RepID=UPI001B3A45D9|nr:T9SS type A sorting domain-containing protein [Aquimarina sp. MMG015]MBQ4801538.1 T9SS type A sorting domain-containing protein [Aquimarina sp. MMG015]
MRNFLYLLLFSNFSVIGQVTLQIETSRITGVAPLYVFFDATQSAGLDGTNDLTNSDFSWNFDTTNTDADGTWEISKGMVAGHVFEQPGIYTVQCTVTDPQGNVDMQTITITITSFTGITYYVSEDGDNSNDGVTAETAWETAEHAIQQLSSNEQILFRRGDTFDTNGENIEELQNGPIIIGAYGSGNSPVLTSNTEEVLQLINSSDIRIMDLHLIPQGTGPFGAGAITVLNNSENIVALRLEIEQTTGRAIYQDESNLFGVFDSQLHDFGVIGVFSGDSNRFSFVGNTIDQLIGTAQPEHGIRIQGGEKQFLAHNILTNLVDTKTAITVRGDGQRHVMIYRNNMDRILGVNPQNAQTIAAISDVTIEGNYIGQNSDYVGQSFGPTINGINIEATNVTIRNNVIDGYRNAVFIGNDGNGVLSGEVDVFHNTVNWRPVTPESGTSGRIVRVRDAFEVNIQNNAISVSNEMEGEILNQDGLSTNIFTSSNLVTENPNYISGTLPESAADQNNILNYISTEFSPMVNQGSNSIPVFFDIMNNQRPSGSNKDIGAFEFIDINLSIEESLQESFFIYPNPVTDYIYINSINAIYDLAFTDINGKLLFKKEGCKFPIDIRNFPQGLYFLSLKNEKMVVTYKIIKQTIPN